MTERLQWDYEGGTLQRCNIRAYGGYEFWESWSGERYSRPVAIDAEESIRRARSRWEFAIGKRFERYKHSTVETFRETNRRNTRDEFSEARTQVRNKVRSFAHWWAEHYHKSDRDPRKAALKTMVLSGAPGCGKTHLSISALRILALDGGLSWQAWPVSQLLDEKKRSYNDKACPDPIDKCISCDVLLLDDLGNHTKSAHSVQVLFDLFDGRARMNPLGLAIINTNAGRGRNFWTQLISQEMSSQAQAVADRIIESSFQLNMEADGKPIPSRRSG